MSSDFVVGVVVVLGGTALVFVLIGLIIDAIESVSSKLSERIVTAERRRQRSFKRRLKPWRRRVGAQGCPPVYPPNSEG